MKTYEEIREIAEAEGLRTIETTSEANGYPAHLRLAIVGFDSLEQAREVAERHGMEVMEFDRRDGWQLWHRNIDTVWEEYDAVGCFADEADIYKAADAEDFFQKEVKGMLSSFNSFDEVQAFIDDQKEIYDDIALLGEDECLVVFHSGHRETFPLKSMEFSYDTKQRIIGIID